jgi:uncharacterized protein GlcG (DUF336 family)
MTLTSQVAEHIVRAAQATATELGVRVSVAVVDHRGDVVLLARMDDARHFTVDMARGKAMVSGLFGEPSAAFFEQAGSPAFLALNRLHLDRLIFFRGAVPLLEAGRLIGGVGVSGATEEEDEEIARAGATALDDLDRQERRSDVDGTPIEGTG